MTQMVRKEIYITPQDDELLKRRAEQLGVSEADLIRQAVEQIARQAAKREEAIKAWEETIAFARERAKLPIAGTGGDRGWTREELYDERPKYLSR